MKKITNSLIALFLLIGSFTISAQVAVDTTSGIISTTPADSLVFQHTCSGNNRLMLVGVFYSQFTSVFAVDSVTYDNVKLNPIGMAGSSSNSNGTQTFYIKAPSAGMHDIRIYLSGSPVKVVAAAISFENVDLSSPVGLGNSGSSFSGQDSLTVNTQGIGSLVVDLVGNSACGSASTLSFGSGQTPEIVLDNSSGPEAAITTKPAPVPGAYPMEQFGYCSGLEMFFHSFEVRDIAFANIAEIRYELAFELFPNPAELMINVKTNDEIQNVSITDVLGNTVMLVSLLNGSMLDISDLKTGVYFIRAESKGKVGTRMFVKI